MKTFLSALAKTRRLALAVPLLAISCTEIGVPDVASNRAVIGPALTILSLDFERTNFLPGATVSGSVADAQKARLIATPTRGELRQKALGPIPTEVRLIVRELVTKNGRVTVRGDLALRDLGLGVILAEKVGFAASGAMPSDPAGVNASGLVFRGIEDDIVAWLRTLECNTATRKCGVPPPPAMTVEPEDALTEGADLNLAGMVGRRPSGLRRINSSGIDPDQIVAAAPQAQAVSAAPPANMTPVGETVAALGLLDRSGLWLQTPLVSSEGPGEIQIKGSNRRIPVTLVPKDGPRGGGSQLSLAAMSELNIDMTDLVTLVVYR